jgi:hypothetical protein
MSSVVPCRIPSGGVSKGVRAFRFCYILLNTGASVEEFICYGGGGGTMVCVRERTIPTERPPLTAACRRSDCQLFRIEGATWSAWRIRTAVFSVFLDRSRYTFLSSSSSVVLTRLSGPRSRPITFFLVPEFMGGKGYELDRHCGLVVRVPGYRSRGPVSIPGATRFSEK